MPGKAFISRGQRKKTTKPAGSWLNSTTESNRPGLLLTVRALSFRLNALPRSPTWMGTLIFNLIQTIGLGSIPVLSSCAELLSLTETIYNLTTRFAIRRPVWSKGMDITFGGGNVSDPSNSVVETLLNHKSIRSYRDETPSDETIETIVQAGQQAPFASQMYSVLLTRKGHLPFKAPLLFTICVDIHKLEKVMNERDWELTTNDLSLLLFGIQDAALMAENMVIAGESMGLGSCFLGEAPYFADKIIEEYDLPQKVFPLVQLAMGYPEHDKPTRPRYPLEFVLFEDEYPEFGQDQLRRAMETMDEGYIDQDYYEENNAKIPLEGDEEDEYTYDNYGWTEHISRKWGQWLQDPEELLEQFKKCGFDLSSVGK